MGLLSLAFLRQVVNPHIIGFENNIVKAGIKPSRIRRITLSYPEGNKGVSSVIVKESAAHWPNDPKIGDREPTFYATLYPRLGFQSLHVYHTGVDPDTQQRVIVMQDLAPDYKFPPPTHRWTWEELCSVLRTYARLHIHGRGSLPSADARTWMLNVQEIHWHPQDLLPMAEELATRGIWERLPGLEGLIVQTSLDAEKMNDYPITLIHNDVYPPNIGLPTDPDAEAVLIDWEMVGWGIAELDLAYMFMLPFRNTQQIDRQKALDYYWGRREEMEGHSPSARERHAAQRHADALWALYLIPLAHQAALRPYPAGSDQRAYWDNMFSVLYETLKALCH